MFPIALNLPHERVPERCRTLVAKGDTVWVWPGIPLTLRRGTEVLPVASENIRFWVTRLHGPEALDRDILRAIEAAAQQLKTGNEAAAQESLDALCLTELSPDGAALVRAVGNHLGIKPLDLPLRQSMRTWDAQDIARLLPMFKHYTEAARAFAKGAIPFDGIEGSGFNPDEHPRWPAGAPDSQGGEFAPKDESEAAIIPVASNGPRKPTTGSGSKHPGPRDPNSPSDQLSPDEPGVRFLSPGEQPDDTISPQGAPRGIGDNQGPPLEEPPEIPEDEPIGISRYETVKAIGRWMVAALAAGAVAAVDRILTNLRTIYWIMKAPFYYYDQLEANLDPPKTLEELQDALDTPEPGYHEHHIVEKTPAERDGFSWWQINSRDNLVSIPAMKHREITTWFQTPNPYYRIDGEMVSPREYLRGKSWEERRRIGLYALKKFGVLKE